MKFNIMGVQNKIENAVPKDILWHLLVGAELSQLAFIDIRLIVVAPLVGLLKELYDKFIRGTGFSFIDWAATAVPVVPTLLIMLIRCILS